MLSPCPLSEDDAENPDASKRGGQPNPEKNCKVCGDRAVGFNFSVITCESCKAFFRRNAHREQMLKCPFSQNCVINALSRRFCQACRLQRCFQVGMKKEWIMREGRGSRKHRLASIPQEDEEIKKMFDQLAEGDVTVPKQVLVELVKKSKLGRLTACQCKCTCGFYPPDTRLIAAPPYLVQGVPTAGEIVMPLNVASQQQPQQQQQFIRTTPEPFYPEQLNKGCLTTSVDTSPFMPQPLTANVPDTMIPLEGNVHSTLTIQHAFTSVAKSGDECAATNAFERLPADDKSLLQELIFANDVLKQPLDLPTNQKASGDMSLMDVVRMTDLALRRIINMAKQLTFFKNLSNEDQIALLKGSCSELLILRGVMVFDPSRHVWNTDVAQGSSDFEIKLDVLKRSKESKHYEEHKRFLATFSEKWCKNEYIMLLLNAVTLFSPDRMNLHDTQKLRKLQQRYSDILRRYLGNLYEASEAEQAYQALLQKLEELTHLSQSLLRIYHGLNASEVDPLLLELFDLT